MLSRLVYLFYLLALLTNALSVSYRISYLPAASRKGLGLDLKAGLHRGARLSPFPARLLELVQELPVQIKVLNLLFYAPYIVVK